MSRLKKRCLAGSLAAHGALLLILIFSSAFFPARDQNDEVESTLEMVNLTDGKTTSPHPSENAAPAAQVETRREPPPPSNPEPPVRQAQPPARPVAPPAAEKEEEPAAISDHGTLPKPVAKPKSAKKESGSKTLATKPAREIGALVPIKTAGTTTSSSQSQSQARDQSRHNLAKAIGEAGEVIAKQGSSSVEIGTPGVELGAAFANYKATIYSVYKAAYDEEALQAGEFATEEMTLAVSVTISRNGDVSESKVTSHSGNNKMDRLVRRVLEKIKFVAPFPPEAKDSERTFKIQFKLKPNGQLG